MSGIAATLGLFLVFLLGSLTEWRNVTLYCLAVPILTMIAVCFVSLPAIHSSSKQLYNINDVNL